MTEYHGSCETAARKVIDRVGKNIVLGIPLGLGKPIGFLNALYRLVEADPSINLTIMTALTLARPVRFGSELEKRFVEPILARLLKDYEDPLYEAARMTDTLPPNIQVIEFFLAPGKYLHNRYVQENYISTKYTSAVDDLVHRGMNVIAQKVARSDTNPDEYSLSSNTDLFKDVLDRMREMGTLNHVSIVGQVNNNLPFIEHDAVVHADVFTDIVDTKVYRTLFALPRDEVSQQDHMIGLYSSALIKDDGCLQIGIGTLSTALANALCMRQKNNALYRETMQQLHVTSRYEKLVTEEGGLAPFEKGIYASTEMLSDEYIYLWQQDVVKKRVYDDVGLQTLLNRGEITEDVTPALVDKLINNRIINSNLTDSDVRFLQRFGIIKSNIKYQNGTFLLENGEKIPADVRNEKILGQRLKTGKVIHGGFFIGGTNFYQALRDLNPEQRQQIDMTRISRTNALTWWPELAALQRINGRFVNSAMMVTLGGCVVSDGLKNIEEVSGVGGQFDFVNMAHNLHDARSIIICRSVRELKGEAASNVIWNYPNITIPRYLRDIVVTEYGIADLRAKTDCEVVKELLNVTDSRFQEALLGQAKKYGKVQSDYHIPEEYRNNYPEKINEIISAIQAKGCCQPYPFGSDLTPEEIQLKHSLEKMQTYTKFEIFRNSVKGLFISNEKFQSYLERVGLLKPDNLENKIYQSLLKYALQ